MLLEPHIDIDGEDMKLNKKLTLLIFAGCVLAGITISGIDIFLNTYSGPHKITGRITNITYYEKDLGVFTKVTFDGTKTISFAGHLMFDVGKPYTITYHKYGLLWELLGYEAYNSIDYASVIE